MEGTGKIDPVGYVFTPFGSSLSDNDIAEIAAAGNLGRIERRGLAGLPAEPQLTRLDDACLAQELEAPGFLADPDDTGSWRHLARQVVLVEEGPAAQIIVVGLGIGPVGAIALVVWRQHLALAALVARTPVVTGR